jgi:tight adherence protein B
MMVFSIFLVVTWLGVLVVWWSWSHSRQQADLDRMKARLIGAPETKRSVRRGPVLIQGEDTERGKYITQLLQRLDLNQRLRLLIEQAGLKWNVARTMHGSLALFLLGFTTAWYMAPAYRQFALIPAVVLGALPVLYVLRMRAARMKKFEAQFPESLEFLSRSMRAGHAFSVALEMIHSEFQEPLAGEFRRAFDEQNLGLPLDVALQKMAQRVPLIDVQFFVSAVILQKRTGGNLSEVLDKLAYLIRERFKLRGQIRAISANGRMTGMALSMIPASVGVIMCYVNPDYARFFTDDPTGQMMLGGAVALQLVGYGIIKKIVTIEV